MSSDTSHAKRPIFNHNWKDDQIFKPGPSRPVVNTLGLKEFQHTADFKYI